MTAKRTTQVKPIPVVIQGGRKINPTAHRSFVAPPTPDLPSKDNDDNNDDLGNEGYEASFESSAPPVINRQDKLTNPDAEHIICAWFLSTSFDDEAAHLRTAHQLMDFLTPDDFSQSVYKNIYTTVVDLLAQRKPCSPTAVLDLAATHERYVGTLDDLGSLQGDPIAMTADEVSLLHDAQILREHTGRRMIRKRLLNAIDELHIKPLQESVTAINDEAQVFDNLVENVNAGPAHISLPMSNVVTHLVTPADEGAVAIRTGYRDLDAATNGGLRDEEFWIVAGRPGMGKTACVGGIGRNIAIDHTHTRPVLFFSLEMSAEALASRKLASESGVSAHFLRRGGWEENDPNTQKVLDVLGRFQGADKDERPMLRLYIDDRPGLSLADIRATARQFVRDHKHLYQQAPVIIVDYMQIISSPSIGRGEYNASQVVGKNSQGLKALARELKTPVIALSQLNRELEKRINKRPMPSDLKESGSLEQDADVILFLYRDSVYNSDADPSHAEFIIGKQREGKTGSIPMIYRGDLVRFENSYQEAFHSSDD